METRRLKLNLKTKKREKWRRGRNELKTIDATLKLITGVTNMNQIFKDVTGNKAVKIKEQRKTVIVTGTQLKLDLFCSH